MKKAPTKQVPDQNPQNSIAQASKVNRKKILNNHQVLRYSLKDEIKKAFDLFDITGSGSS